MIKLSESVTLIEEDDDPREFLADVPGAVLIGQCFREKISSCQGFPVRLHFGRFLADNVITVLAVDVGTMPTPEGTVVVVGGLSDEKYYYDVDGIKADWLILDWGKKQEGS